MFENALAASLNTLDIVVIALVGFAAVIGAIRGLSSSMRGLSTFCIIVFSALLLSNMIYPKLVETSIGVKVDEKVDEWVNGWEEDWTIVFTHRLDTNTDMVNVYVEKINDDGVAEWVSMGDLISDESSKWAIYLASFARLAYPDATRENPSEPLANALSNTIVNVVLLFAVFIVLALVLWLVIVLLRSLAKKKKKNDGVSILGRVGGAVWTMGGVVTAIFIIFGFMAVISIVTEFGFMKDSTLLIKLFDVNPLKTVITTLLGK